MPEPRSCYEKRLKKYEQIVKTLEKKAKTLGNLRLLSFLAGLGFAGLLYRSGAVILSIGMFLAGIMFFIYFLIKYNHVHEKIRYTNSLLTINLVSLKRLEGKWTEFPDTGEDFREADHPYSGDLDIFGQGSLFQFINTAVTYYGRKKLKDFLAEPPENQTNLYLRQEAVTELSGMLIWRQKFRAAGMEIREHRGGPAPLIRWARYQYEFYRKPSVKFIVRTLPAVTITLILLYLAFFPSLKYVVVVLLVLQGCLLYLNGKERVKILNTVYKYENSIKTYYTMLKHFEQRHFKSDLLDSMQKSLLILNKHRAFQQLEKLTKLADFISNRDNAVFIAINIITLWDYQCMIALEKWKQESGRYLNKWLETLGQIEALCSLALVRFDNYDWGMPTFTDSTAGIQAKALGHPLLTGTRVKNDLVIAPPSSILLITGSNMSGKSTLLRTAGINLVLAYAGGPVCAQEFSCSIMPIYTCMRVSDNLEKSTSSFYAELLRIKMIVEASEETRLFFLLDEIFKGTNSQDRHTGAKILIKQLLKAGSLGLVSTHDLELGELEHETAGRIKNYHFREYYTDNQIHFDYRLHPGISSTRNALFLIKMAGIKTDERG